MSDFQDDFFFGKTVGSGAKQGKGNGLSVSTELFADIPTIVCLHSDECLYFNAFLLTFRSHCIKIKMKNANCLHFQRFCVMLNLRHNRIFPGSASVYFTFGKNACSLFAYLQYEGKVVSQQTELCIFRCVASAAHFFILRRKMKNETGIHKKSGNRTCRHPAAHRRPPCRLCRHRAAVMEPRQPAHPHRRRGNKRYLWRESHLDTGR